MCASTLACGAVVLARYDSNRLAGKVLAEVEGKPLIWYCIQRCRAVAALSSRIVVATSDRKIDDPIADYAAAEGLGIFRGSAHNVAGRFLGAARAFELDAAARINVDCPFAVPDLLVEGCEVLRRQTEAEFVTNLCPRTYPYGIVLEIFRTSAFAEGYARMISADHFEHVTKYFYDTSKDRRFVNLERPGSNGASGDCQRYHLTVDRPDQLERFRAFVRGCRVPWPQVDYRNAIALGGLGQ
jgi:spore coat polysaccharide biosynthesis protein SpsF